jgi:hypothetical protein
MHLSLTWHILRCVCLGRRRNLTYSITALYRDYTGPKQELLFSTWENHATNNLHRGLSFDIGARRRDAARPGPGVSGSPYHGGGTYVHNPGRFRAADWIDDSGPDDGQWSVIASSRSAARQHCGRPGRERQTSRCACGPLRIKRIGTISDAPLREPCMPADAHACMYMYCTVCSRSILP